MEKEPEQTCHRVPNLLDYSAIRPPKPPPEAKQTEGVRTKENTKLMVLTFYA